MARVSTYELKAGDVVSVEGIPMTLTTRSEREDKYGTVVSFRAVPVEPITCKCDVWNCSAEWIAKWVRTQGYWVVQGNDRAMWNVI